ncbi:MAG: hypothetical protein WA191_11305 [Telluria sp.]|nr:hypothetical protein [Telluria sp.]
MEIVQTLHGNHTLEAVRNQTARQGSNSRMGRRENLSRRFGRHIAIKAFLRGIDMKKGAEGLDMDQEEHFCFNSTAASLII